MWSKSSLPNNTNWGILRWLHFHNVSFSVTWIPSTPPKNHTLDSNFFAVNYLLFFPRLDSRNSIVDTMEWLVHCFNRFTWNRWTDPHHHFMLLLVICCKEYSILCLCAVLFTIYFKLLIIKKMALYTFEFGSRFTIRKDFFGVLPTSFRPCTSLRLANTLKLLDEFGQPVIAKNPKRTYQNINFEHINSNHYNQ